MVSTRATSGHEQSNGSNDTTAAAGEKHGIERQTPDSSPDHKRAKISKSGETHQITLEETLSKSGETLPKDQNPPEDDATRDEDEDKPSTEDGGKTSTAEQVHKDTKVPSSILEKGIIYFFFRARVNTDEPESVDDIARSHLILRPMAKDSQLGKGPIGDAGNTRLFALPKKVLPQSGKDRFLMFCQKAGVSFEDLKQEFLGGSDKETKTRGTSHTPAVTPVGEGVYAITTTGRESHLAYILTLPSELGEVQQDLGLRKRGSFIVSTKNPEYPGPANARLPKDPDFPTEVQKEFRSLRWLPSKPAHFDYPNSQILLVGESGGIDKAMEMGKKDAQDGKEEPMEVMDELEDEDTRRMEGLGNDDSAAIFADLEVNAKDYPKLQTTF